MPPSTSAVSVYIFILPDSHEVTVASDLWPNKSNCLISESVSKFRGCLDNCNFPEGLTQIRRSNVQRLSMISVTGSSHPCYCCLATELNLDTMRKFQCPLIFFTCLPLVVRVKLKRDTQACHHLLVQFLLWKMVCHFVSQGYTEPPKWDRLVATQWCNRSSNAATEGWSPWIETQLKFVQHLWQIWKDY